jgi:hypothetical protein
MSILARLGRALGALVFIACGVALYLFMAEVDSLDCRRESGSCTLTHRRANHSEVRRFPVEGLVGAELGGIGLTTKLRGSAGVRIVLLTRTESIPLMDYATGVGRDAMEQDVIAVRRFVATSSQRRLTLGRDNRRISALAGGTFALFGAVMLVMAFWPTRSRP